MSVTLIENDVSAPLQAYDNMKPYWEKILALKGGTEVIRSYGKRFLPKEEAESEKAYQVRLARTFLYEAYNDTIRKITSKPFSRRIAVTGFEEDSEKWGDFQKIQNDVDRSGKNIDLWTEEVFETAVDFGLTHILIDYPTVPEGSTLEDEIRLGARPTWVHVPPPALIGWRSSGLGEHATLDQVRIRQVKMEPYGQYGEREVEYVRVITPTTFETFRKTEESNWELVSKNSTGEPGPTNHTFGQIPLITLYFNKTGTMEALPSLNGLANLNIEHWQSSSDQRTVLTMARFGILFGKGFDDKQVKDGLEVGPKRIITTTSTEADLKFVEHTGAAIQAGERDLANIQQRMEVMGLQPFIKQSGVETATSKLVHESKTESAIHTWINRTETALVQCFEFSARWLNKSLPKDFKIDIFSDFGITLGATDDMRLLLDIWGSGGIDHETFLKEIRRRGLIEEMSNLHQIMERTTGELAAPPEKGDPDANNK